MPPSPSEIESGGGTTEGMAPTASPSVSGCSSSRTRIGHSLVATVISVVFGLLMITGNNNDQHQNQSRRLRRTSTILLCVGTLFLATLWVGSSIMYPNSEVSAAVESPYGHSKDIHHVDDQTKKSMNEQTMENKITVATHQHVQHASSSENQLQQAESLNQHRPRRLQAEDEDTKCTVGVEILLDGCERSLVVDAPAIRVFGKSFKMTSNIFPLFFFHAIDHFIPKIILLDQSPCISPKPKPN